MKNIILMILAISSFMGTDGLRFKFEVNTYKEPYTEIYLKLEVINEGKERVALPDFGEVGGLKHLIAKGIFKVEVRGEIDKICSINGPKATPIIGEIRYKYLGFGERIIYDLRDGKGYLGIIDEGIYYLKGIWDSRGLEKGYRSYWESQEIDIKKEIQNSEDIRLIEELKKIYPTTKKGEYYQSYKCKLLDIISLKDFILQNFPTSTYAGWVLINEGYYYIRPENWQNIKISAYIKESLYKNDRSVESMKEYAGERIEKLKEYLKERPDFALSDWMRFEISFWNAYQGNYKQAKEEAESLIKVSKDERAKTKAEELLKCLRENNFIK